MGGLITWDLPTGVISGVSFRAKKHHCLRLSSVYSASLVSLLGTLGRPCCFHTHERCKYACEIFFIWYEKSPLNYLETEVPGIEGDATITQCINSRSVSAIPQTWHELQCMNFYSVEDAMKKLFWGAIGSVYCEWCSALHRLVSMSLCLTQHLANEC